MYDVVIDMNNLYIKNTNTSSSRGTTMVLIGCQKVMGLGLCQGQDFTDKMSRLGNSVVSKLKSLLKIVKKNNK